ncbi:MAG: hypothetical protein AB7O97_00880 [Planctomycetota bacterium]
MQPHRIRSPRRAAFALVASALAALASGAPVRGQDAPPVVTCRNCGNHGMHDCSKHKKGWLEREQAILFCSVAQECKTCAGALAVDCKVCRNEAAEAELERRRKLAQEWREALRTGIDEHAKGEPLLHLKTENVDLGCGIERLTVGRDKLDTHEILHLYGERIEALRALFLGELQLEEGDFSTRLRVYMCRDGRQSSNLAPRVTGIGGNMAVGVKLMGIEAVYCMWQNPRGLPDDEALHRNIVHNVTHLLLANMAPAGYFGNPKNGWVDEGLAHWFEEKLDGKCTNYCFEEVLLQQGQLYKGGRWKVPVRRSLEAGELVSLAELGEKNTDQLTFPEHAQSFAMVDYLMQVFGGDKMREFLRLLKGKTEMRDALQKVYGMNPLQFDPAFHEWVRETYPLVEPPR